MKRFSALLLCAAMLLSLAACGSSGAPAPTDATASATIPTAAPTAMPTDASTEPVPSGTVSDVIQLIDNDAVSVYITKIEHNEHLGMQLHIQCINKTSRPLLFSWDMVSVCGYMYDPMWAVEVAAGKTSNSTIDLDTHELELMGIPSVDETTFTLRIVDSENWMEKPLVEEAFTIYPTGLNAEALILPQRAARSGDVVIVDNENIRFIITGFDAAACTLHVYLENKTDRNLMYSWDRVSVNGFMADPFWAASVAAGKKACAEITFSRSDFEANGITEVSDIEFSLLVSDYDDWEADYLLEETYTYKP
ncbi:MAG: hypothetical protein IKT52_08220 [Oscillospiraceae bacterium]|nr:hypothetical protein [Oscillospiraceae bacterium]